jgi:hypothetical protein
MIQIGKNKAPAIKNPQASVDKQVIM